jgi:protease I
MPDSIAGKRIAILATDRFEQAELLEPRKALLEAGARVDVVAPHPGEIQGMNHFDLGEMVKVDRTLAEIRSADYDALVLPGGVANPDQLRLESKAVELVREFCEQDKPIAAICHGLWLLAEADVVRGRRMTSWPSLRTDLRNAGADWVDEESVVDRGFVTSRKPDDLPAFNRNMIRVFAEAAPARA